MRLSHVGLKVPFARKYSGAVKARELDFGLVDFFIDGMERHGGFVLASGSTGTGDGIRGV